ncbi:MAG: DUF4214 domain-containing protein [Acidimicrobiales bacterium]
MPHASTPRRLAAVVLVSALALGVGAGLAPPAGAATDANRTYVRALYEDLLDRSDLTVNAAGIEFWADRLDTQTRLQVTTGIQKATSEYYGHVVDIAYQVFLGRDADSSGRAFYVDAWRSRTRTLEAVVYALVGSNEYYVFNGSNDVDFVEAAYFDILGREPEPAEMADGLALVAATSRATLARQLETSTERRRQAVTYAYDNFLGRTANPGNDYWVDRIADGLRRVLSTPPSSPPRVLPANS